MSKRMKFNIIKEAYTKLDNSGSIFRSKVLLLQKAKQKLKSIKLKDIEDFLKGTDSHTLHRRHLLRYPTRKVICQGINYQWMADLIILSDKHARLNKHRYILAVIDCFSRKLFCKELKKKTGKEVLLKFTSFIKKQGKPQSLYTDAGKEFVNKQFQDYLKREKIKFFVSQNVWHASIIERTIRTLKELIFKWMTHKNTEVFIPHLQKFVNSYNSTPHSSLPKGMSPVDVNAKNSEKVWKYQYASILRKAGYPSPQLQTGQLVRITRKSETFRKGYQTKFSKEKFIVVKVHPSFPTTYKLKSADKGDVIEGLFYKEELQPVK